jgi:hypothetical protein
MKKLKHNSWVTVYHRIDNEGNHYYWFMDGTKVIYLCWGETGLIPNHGDRFPHPKKNIDLHLDDILWETDDDC